MTRQMCQTKPHRFLFYWADIGAESQAPRCRGVHWCSLPGSHASMTRSTLSPRGSPRRVHSHHIAHIALPLRSLYPAVGADKVRLSLHIARPRSAFSAAAFARWGSRRVAAVHPPVYYCSAHTHSPRAETHSPRLHPPAIMWTSPASPPSLSLPPSPPAAAGRPGSHWIPMIMKWDTLKVAASLAVI